MGPLNDQRPADDEVAQRRKYEIEEQDRGHFKTRAAMAFIIGNAIGLLKNILYPDEASANHSGQAAAAESPPALRRMPTSSKVQQRRICRPPRTRGREQRIRRTCPHT